MAQTRQVKGKPGNPYRPWHSTLPKAGSMYVKTYRYMHRYTNLEIVSKSYMSQDLKFEATANLKTHFRVKLAIRKVKLAH